MKTKVLFTTNSLRRGGKERQLTLLFSSLSNEKFDKHILCKRVTQNNYLEEYNIDPNLVTVDWKIKGFYRTLKYIKPDVVWGWDMISVFYLIILAPFFKYKIVNGSIRHGVRSQKLTHYLRSIIAWISPWVVANSEAGLRANNMKRSPKRIVLYNGIQEKKEEINESEKIKKLQALFPDYSPEREIVFISIGNLVPYKDYETVLSAMYDIKNEIKFRYIILGEGPMRSTIKNQIVHYGLNKQVYLAGRVVDVHNYIEIADVMIHSSKGEGVSNAILEAMFAGLPIIATNVGGVPETVWHGSAYLFAYRDKKRLKKHLLAASKLLRFDASSGEYKAHLRKFRKESMIENFEKIIDKIVNK